MIDPQPAHRFRGVAGSRRALPVWLIAGALVACVSATAATPAAPAGLAAALEHGLRPAVLEPGEAAPGGSLRQRMAHHHVSGVAIAWLRDGRVFDADVLEIGFGADGLRMTSGDDAFALLPLAPARFTADGGSIQRNWNSAATRTAACAASA